MPFREQHISHFTTLSSIGIPRVMRIVAIMLISVTVLTTIALLTVPWVQTTAGPGVVTALDPNDRVQDINALVPGRIEEWYVRDGAVVEKGDPIVRIVDNDPQLLDRLRGEREQAERRRDAADVALRTAQLDLDRIETLFDEGLAARRELEQAQIRIEDLKSRLAGVTAEIARLDVDVSRQSAQLVTAPRDGRILRVHAGDQATFVSAGQSLATFAPTTVERAVELFVDGRDIALVYEGAPVRIQFEGWPAVQFSGWPSIAVGVFSGKVASIDPSAQPDGRFRILVTEDPEAEHPWPEDQFVRLGATARGWVLLSTVPLGNELWRQLNNFPPRYVEGAGRA